MKLESEEELACMQKRELHQRLDALEMHLEDLLSDLNTTTQQMNLLNRLLHNGQYQP